MGRTCLLLFIPVEAEDCRACRTGGRGTGRPGGRGFAAIAEDSLVAAPDGRGLKSRRN